MNGDASPLDAQIPAWADDGWPDLVLGVYAWAGRVERAIAMATPDGGEPADPAVVDLLVGAAHLSARVRALVEAATVGSPGASEGPVVDTPAGRLLR